MALCLCTSTSDTVLAPTGTLCCSPPVEAPDAEAVIQRRPKLLEVKHDPRVLVPRGPTGVFAELLASGTDRSWSRLALY